ILNVSAKNKTTGKEQKIVIKAASGLSEAEIQQMVKDAETHADEDRKFHELIQIRNQADSLIHGTSKALKEAGDKITVDEKSQLEKAIEELKESLKGDDKEAIETKLKALTDVSGNMAERLYAQPNADAGNTTDSAAAGATHASDNKDKGDIEDAVFEEVKDKDQDKKDKDKE
ncbi:Hsp70 family protein, partial [Staphylococcus aureus]|nr:Hsp70 family protein [Staphylococcus aureus]